MATTQQPSECGSQTRALVACANFRVPLLTPAWLFVCLFVCCCCCCFPVPRLCVLLFSPVCSYNVTLTVRDNEGASSLAWRTILVINPDDPGTSSLVLIIVIAVVVVIILAVAAFFIHKHLKKKRLAKTNRNTVVPGSTLGASDSATRAPRHRPTGATITPTASTPAGEQPAGAGASAGASTGASAAATGAAATGANDVVAFDTAPATVSAEDAGFNAGYLAGLQAAQAQAAQAEAAQAGGSYAYGDGSEYAGGYGGGGAAAPEAAHEGTHEEWAAAHEWAHGDGEGEGAAAGAASHLAAAATADGGGGGIAGENAYPDAGAAGWGNENYAGDQASPAAVNVLQPMASYDTEASSNHTPARSSAGSIPGVVDAGDAGAAPTGGAVDHGRGRLEPLNK